MNYDDDDAKEEKVYATARDMYDALIGCGCCVYEYDIGFEDLKARIIIEELMDRGHL